MTSPRALPTPRAGPRIFAFIAALTLMQVVILFPILPSNLHVRAGDIASQTIRAPREFAYSSDVLRRQLQEQALRNVPESFSYDVNVKNAQLAKLSDLLGRVSSAKVDPNLSRPQLIDALSSKGATLTQDQRAAISVFSPDEWRQTGDEAMRLLGTVLEEPFASTELNDRLASLPNRVSTGLTAVQGDVAVALVRGLIVPTEKLDPAATQRNRDQAAAGVPTQPKTYARNQVIVREGDVIDAGLVEGLQNAGLLTVRLHYNDLAAVALLALVTSCALAAFLRTFHGEVLLALRRSLMLAVIIAGMVLLAKIYMPIVLPDSKRHFWQFAFPAAAVPMLVVSLFDAGLAVAVAGVAALSVTFTALYLPDLSGIVGLTALQPLEMAAAFFFSGLSGVLIVHRAERFNRFLAAGVAVAVAMAAVLFGFWFLDTSRKAADIAWLLLVSGVSGVVSSLLTVGTFVLLGAVFNISTRLQLMELAQLNQPLLRRLQEEAPGTFHHSILVGNLGERAADLVGADALLVRVGCYYHDIGKLSRPGYFIENQLGGKNPHDELDPQVSNRIVQEHVRYGAELARKYHLPQRVRDFTLEHHGSRLVAYFYRMAAQLDPEVDPVIFTYPGPKPQSRETAIAMLADSTEAVVRAGRDHSFDKIDSLVEGVIAERLAEGQFDDCDLTLRDLRTIADSFKATLRAIYHPRIEYPEPTAAERRRQSRRTADAQRPSGSAVDSPLQPDSPPGAVSASFSAGAEGALSPPADEAEPERSAVLLSFPARLAPVGAPQAAAGDESGAVASAGAATPHASEESSGPAEPAETEAVRAAGRSLP